MSRTRNKGKGAVIAIVVAIAMLVVAFVTVWGIGSNGFKNNDVTTWFNGWGANKVEPGDDEQPAEEDEEPADEQPAGETPDDAAIEEINARLNSAVAGVAELRTGVATLNTDVATINEELESITTAIENAATKTEVQAVIVRFTAMSNALNNAISDLQRYMEATDIVSSDLQDLVENMRNYVRWEAYAETLQAVENLQTSTSAIINTLDAISRRLVNVEESLGIVAECDCGCDENCEICANGCDHCNGNECLNTSDECDCGCDQATCPVCQDGYCDHCGDGSCQYAEEQPEE